MKFSSNLSCLLLCLTILMAACATPPLVYESEEPALENRQVGFRGYRLPLKNGYVAISEVDAQNDPMLREWIQHRADFFDRIRVQADLQDSTFLRSANRTVWFAVEESYTPIPFSRLAPDRRERLLRYSAANFHRRAARFKEEAATFSFQRIGAHDFVRTELVDDLIMERASFCVMGSLNELYHFYGVAFEGEGVLLEKDILNMIQDLSF